MKLKLKSEYKSSLKYLKKSKKFIYLSIWVFLASFLIGFFVAPPEILGEKIFEFFREILEKTEGLSQTGLIGFIFLNNLKSSFYSMILGFFFGVFPLLSSLSNGYLLGFVSSLSVSENGAFSLWRILPHGIFELPAIFISLGLGLKLGTFMFHKDKYGTFKNFLFNSLKVFVYIVIPLLVVAGIVEGSLIYFSRV